MIQESFGNTNNTLRIVNEEVNKLILVLEDMIGIILSSNDINSISMRELKERSIDAKNYMHNLRDSLTNSETILPRESMELCKKEFDTFNDEYIDDVVTTWILNGSREAVMDRLYGACYRMRELVRRIQLLA